MNSRLFAKLSEELKTTVDFLPANTDSAGGYYKDKPLKLCDGWGKGEPIFEKDLICFNGSAEDGLDHESFIIELNGEAGGFCKSSRKPYDLMICIALLRIKHYFPKAEISSDGNAKDWSPAIKLYKKLFRISPPAIIL